MEPRLTSNLPGVDRGQAMLTPLGYQSGSCGYCKSESSQRTPDSRAAYYARSKSMTPHHYQMLMDRGWRRSGTLFYLPDAARSCCPHYTIRLPLSEFQPNRNQRQCLNRWNRYVLGEEYSRHVGMDNSVGDTRPKKSNTQFDLVQKVYSSQNAANIPQRHGVRDIPPEHVFSVTLELPEFSREKFKLYRNYQTHVHHDEEEEVTPSGFTRFLCDSPLQHTNDTTAKDKRLGSYHQCYRLDGRLIAMGVIDLLPHAVSGVYFMYHSDFERWSLGKISALHEAALALKENYGYYYMGYYIHSCEKMKYKADYRPQYVLDLYTYDWHILDAEMRQLMDRQKYASVSRERRRKESIVDEQTDQDEDDVLPEALLPDPADAGSSGKSLLELTMPGVLSLAEVEKMDLDTVRLTIGRGRINEMRDLVAWENGDILDTGQIRGMVSELAATLGAEVISDMIVDLS